MSFWEETKHNKDQKIMITRFTSFETVEDSFTNGFPPEINNNLNYTHWQVNIKHTQLWPVY